MTTEEKNLLLKDLSARLLYGVKCEVLCYGCKHAAKIIGLDNFTAKVIVPGTSIIKEILITSVKLFLFPLSSMTKEQIIEFNQLGDLRIGGYPLDNESYAEPVIYPKVDSCGRYIEICEYDIIPVIDWLNAHHFDYRGLIEKGLAIDATGLNIY